MEIVDWNKKSLDELAEYLENKYQFSSSGEAKAIFELIEFYKKHKDFSQIPKPFTGEMSAFLFVNVLRCLTDEQQASLCANIYIRSKDKALIAALILERWDLKFE